MNTDFRVLLDKSKPWDDNQTKLLDQLISFFYANPAHPGAIEANQILIQLKEDPDLWLAADSILEVAQDPNTKFFALQVLEAAIESKWKILPSDQKNAIKNYIVNMVVKMGANLHDKNYQVVLRKANTLLVQIITKEWNSDWKNVISDIVGASMQDQNVCENNLQLLKILSEEIYDYSKNKMTSTQIKELKETMFKEFESIYNLCSYVIKGYLQNHQQVRISLIETCLNTLYAFLSWIPLGYIFLTDLISDLLQIFEFKELKPACLKCLMEIVVLDIEGSCSEEEVKKIKQNIFTLYSNFIFKLGNFLPCELSLLQEREKLIKQRSTSLTPFDDFCQHLALFLSGFMKTHLGWIDSLVNDPNNPDQGVTVELIKKGFQYLIHLSELPGQIFKICVDFWSEFTGSLLAKGDKGGMNGMSNEPLLLLNSQQNVTLFNSVYQIALVQIRSIMISRMVKPVEALLTIDETGMPVKQHVKNTESNNMYEIMRELLVNLAKLDWDNMRNIITSKLDRQLDGSEWSFDNLNCLCWAIGSISGTVSVDAEKSFLIYIIRGLLNLNEQKKGKENKAVVASDIMYVVGQYPRFLKSNWKFLRTVVKKLFEFMHETFQGIMEMAVNTFLKIAETCKDEFVIVHPNQNDHQQGTFDNSPYIDEIIRKIPEETSMLEPEHKFVFYEAIGHMISQEPNFERKQYLLQGVLQEYWDVWDTMLREIDMNIDSLKQEQNIERFYFILKVHERLAFSVGVDFYKTLARIYMDMLRLYVLYSELISQEIQNNPKYALGHYLVRKIRAVKKQVVNLMSTFIEVSESNTIVAENFIPPLMDILQDYCNNVPDAREPEILTLFTTIVEKQKANVTHLVPKILEDVFNATLNMITTDFNSNIEHRVNLFKFILAIANNCFAALFNIPAEQFKTVIDCIVWAIKHELPSIFDSGLEALFIILKNVSTDQNVANQFYQCYYMNLLQDIFYVLTDGLHKSGFKLQTSILALLFQVVANDFVTVPLITNQSMSNKELVYQYLVDELSKSFVTISKNQTSQYIGQMFNVCFDPVQFKMILRDYLITLTQYDPETLEEQGIGNIDKVQ